MIIPYGQERNSVRLLPWVTIIIVLINLAVHWHMTSRTEAIMNEMMNVGMKPLKYWREKPYLDIMRMWSEDQINYEQSERIEKTLEIFRQMYQGEIPDEDTIADEQQILDAYIDEFNGVKENIPWLKYGFIPAKKKVKTSITYMFLHGGWLHLLSNLLLLYIVGPYIEDVWGKTVYGISYILVGILSAFAFAAHYPDMAGPLIGASGAISGILGAFLVRFWRVKIKFFYWFWFIFGTFKAPAWLMIPLWFANEVLTAKEMDAIYKHGSGVAHWAHVWGFVFGVLIAVGLSYFKFEQRVINKKYEEKHTYTNQGYLDYEEAVKLNEAGKKAEAFELLLKSAQRDIKNTDVVELLWILGTELNQLEQAKGLFIRHIEYELRSDRVGAAAFHYKKLIEQYPNQKFNYQMNIILAEALVEEGSKAMAEDLAADIHEQTKEMMLPGVLIPFAELLLKLETPYCETVIGRVMSHPDIPDAKKAALKESYEAYMVELKKRGAAEDVQIAAIRAVPQSVNRETFALHIEGKGQTKLELKRIKLMSVVKILSEGAKPLFLIDLILDDPREGEAHIRIIRFYSSDFNPMNFIKNSPSVTEAFKSFVMGILKFSGATPLHSMDHLVLKKVKTFPSIEEYELSLKEV